MSDASRHSWPGVLSREIVRLLETLPTNAATLTRELSANDVELVVVPRKQTAASFRLMADENGWTYVGLGKGTVLEFSPKGHNYLAMSALEEISAILEAVIQGRFEESVLMREDKIVRAKGRIQLRDQTLRLRYGRLFPFSFFRRTVELQHIYEPYDLSCTGLGGQ